MRLPIALEYKGSVYVEADLTAPTPRVIASTQEAAGKGQFRAIHVFLAGVVRSLTTDDGTELSDIVAVKEACRRMPLRSANTLISYSLLENDSDDGIDGRYECPSCGNILVCEYVSDEDDNRDHLKDLPVINMEQSEPRTIEATLSSPVTVREATQGTEALIAKSLSIRHPTVADAIDAERDAPATATMRHQIATLAHALLSINGEELSPSIAPTYGIVLFGNMATSSLAKLSDETRRWGLQETVKKNCPRCGRTWEEQVNTSNFFASALAS